MPTETPSLWTDRPDDWLTAPAAEPAAPPSDPAPPRPRRPAPRRRRGRYVAGALAAVAIAGSGGAGFLLAGDEDAAPAPVAALPAAAGAVPATAAGTIYARASGAVVNIQVTSGRGQGSGTGFVIDRDGTIVTNAHVVAGATSARVRFGDDDAPVTARVAGADPSTDLAVLRVDPSATRSVQPLALADSDDVEVGDAALAIGYPLGLDRTATSGIVSGVGRQIEAPNGFSIDEVIQTDAPINPGNSGGPLLDTRGRVVGVNSQIATAGAGGGNVGIGFAVPSDTVREVVPRLKAGQSVERAWLGVSTAEAAGGGAGAQVAAVTAGGPAAEAGLRAGDVITTVDGRAIGSPDDVADAVAGRRPGDAVTVAVRRAGGVETLRLTLGERPASAAAATGQTPGSPRP
jgi:putative serine protease PepD